MRSRRSWFSLPTGWLAVSLAGVAFLFASSSVRAQEPDSSARERARLHFHAGQELVEAGRYSAAYSEFRAGYDLSGRPLFLFNMAECARSTNMLARARDLYRQYLEEDPEGSMAATARTNLAELEVSLAAPQPASAAATDTAGDDAEPGGVPTPAEAAQSAAGGTEAGPLDVDSAPASSPPFWEDWPFWTIVGGIVLAGLVATGVVLGVEAGQGPSCGSGCQAVDFTQMMH